MSGRHPGLATIPRLAWVAAADRPADFVTVPRLVCMPTLAVAAARRKESTVPLDPNPGHDRKPPLVLHVGHEELVIRQRYEVVSILNDILVGGWFLVGSVLFFYPAHNTLAVWMFVIGSVEMLIRPIIRLARRIHLRRLNPELPTEAARDF